MKILPAIGHKIIKYESKNTVSARYHRNKDKALASGILTGIEVCRLPYWEIHDVGITAMFGTLTVNYIRNTAKIFKELLPIRKRARQIKNQQNR